jgi:hypothetical protein
VSHANLKKAFNLRRGKVRTAKTINLRLFVVAICLATFFLPVGYAASIPSDSWWLYSLWDKALLAFYILISFCSLLISYWVYDEHKKVSERESYYSREINSIKQKLDSIDETLKELQKEKKKE